MKGKCDTFSVDEQRNWLCFVYLEVKLDEHRFG